jgi:asparagine synthase (glutamine-hydrolysing)
MITSLLSGGVDSTIVTTIARPNLAFTGEYETPGFTEGIVPSVLCKKIGIEHKIIKPTRVDFESYIDEIVWYSDTPVTWTAFNLYMMFKEVAQTGSRVCLTGEGSDEIFNGYARHSIYLNAWNIINSPLWPQYKELIFNFQSDPIASYLKLTSRSSVESLYSKNLYTELFYKNKNLSNFISAVDFKTSMQILLQMADRMSMRFGVEARSPFLDYRIIEFGMKLNTRFKMKDTIGKYIVRKTGELLNNGVDYLSVEKKGFGVPFNYWYGESGFSRHAYFNLSLKKHAELYESFKKFNTALNIFSIIGQK